MSGVLIKVLAFGIAAIIGAAIGCAFFYVVFSFPIWLYGKPDILIVWGWFGVPIGFAGGVFLFARVTVGLGWTFVATFSPRKRKSTAANPDTTAELSPNNSLERPR